MTCQKAKKNHRAGRARRLKTHASPAVERLLFALESFAATHPRKASSSFCPKTDHLFFKTHTVAAALEGIYFTLLFPPTANGGCSIFSNGQICGAFARSLNPHRSCAAGCSSSKGGERRLSFGVMIRWLKTFLLDGGGVATGFFSVSALASTGQLFGFGLALWKVLSWQWAHTRALTSGRDERMKTTPGRDCGELEEVKTRSVLKASALIYLFALGMPLRADKT